MPASLGEAGGKRLPEKLHLERARSGSSGRAREAAGRDAELRPVERLRQGVPPVDLQTQLCSVGRRSLIKNFPSFRLKMYE